MDAARTARRLGADEAIVVYRRTQAQMPANEVELPEALDEGVQVKWLSTITQVDSGTMTVERMELDESGVPHATGVFEELQGDCVVLALGQDVDRSLLDTVPGVEMVDGVVQVDATMMTGAPGVFAGGDAVPSARSVTVSIGHGRQAAEHIHAWLTSSSASVPAQGEPVAFEQLNPWYFSDAPHAVRPRLEKARLTGDFGEVVGGLDAETALYEARRCMSCGNCFGCDNCYGVCPDSAVLKIAGAGAHGYEIDLEYCKGCGLCAEECPAGAIVMEPESS
jgi:NADPH-dependent glutamate synthase beta subunit-like oxidoreductase